MDAKLQLRVQRYGWDEAAPHYEAGWQAQLRPSHDTLMKCADLRQGDRVIETACGTGMITLRAAADVGENGHVFATDLSQKMVDELSQRAADAGHGNITAARMSAEDLDVERDSFDKALCALGLMYVPNPAQALAEMHRALKSGGRATVTVWGERKNCGWAEIFPIVDARVASEVCPLFFGTGGAGVLAGLMRSAGFTDVAEHRQKEELHFASDADLVTSVVHAGPVALAVKRFAPDVLSDVQQEFIASVKGYKLPDSTYKVAGEFVTVSGVKA